MKKIVLTIGAAVLGFTSANAQISIAPEIGAQLSTMSAEYNGMDDKGEYLPGLKIGAVMDIGLTDMISIQPGLFYSMKGYENDFTSTVIIGGLTYTEERNAKVRANYLEVPFNLQFKFDAGAGRFFVGAGPYVAFAVGGQVSSERVRTLVGNNNEGTRITESSERDLEIGDNIVRDDIESSDAGLNVNLGYEWSSGLFLRGNAGFGLKNIMPGGNDNNSLRNMSVGISLGYMFGI